MKEVGEEKIGESNEEIEIESEEKARAIINANVQYKNQSYILWGKRKDIATGTIIEFTK